MQHWQVVFLVAWLSHRPRGVGACPAASERTCQHGGFVLFVVHDVVRGWAACCPGSCSASSCCFVVQWCCLQFLGGRGTGCHAPHHVCTLLYTKLPWWPTHGLANGGMHDNVSTYIAATPCILGHNAIQFKLKLHSHA